MGPRGGPAGPSAQEADLLKLQKQLMEKQAMLQRALANGKRAGGGAATSVRVALPIHDFRRPSSRARHAFREIPLALVADTRPTPSSTQKKPARPKKDGPVRTQRCVARARPAPRRRVPAPARVSGAPAVPGTSAHFSQSRTIPRLTPPSPRISHPSAFSNAPEPGGDFDALVPGSGAADPDAFPLAGAAPTPSPPGGLRRNPFSFDPEDDPVVCHMVHNAQAQAAARVSRAKEEQAAAAAREAAARRPPPPPTPAELAARRKAYLEQRLNAKRKFAELECSIECLAAKVVERAEIRDRLSAAADEAAAAAADAERRRRAAAAGRSVRDSAPSRRGAAGPAPFDSAAFAAVAAKRKLEIINKQCLVSLKQLMQHKWAFPFCAPVDHAALNLPTYPEIVKQPMDLGTVRQGIERGGVYSSCEEVNRDVALTFANAKLFNPPATDVHVMATTLEEFWAPRWEAIKERVREVDEGMAVEKESAEKKSAEMVARQTLAAEEMRCAGLMADLDLLRRQLGDLKRASIRVVAPLAPGERAKLRRVMTALPRGFRGIARDIIAETEGGHKVPVDGVEGWGEVLEDLDLFRPVAHRRLARFAKVRRRNRRAIDAGMCAAPEDGFDAEDENREFPSNLDEDEKEAAGKEDARAEAGIVGGEKADAGQEDAMAAAAAAAAAAAVGAAGKEPAEEDPLMALALGGGDVWAPMTDGGGSEPELVKLVSGGP